MILTSHVRIIIFILLFLFFILPPFSQARENDYCITPKENGSVNWSTGAVKATGKASPSDNTLNESPDAILERAKLDARRNLIKILKQIAFNSTDSTSFSPGDAIMAGIEKRAMDAAISQQHYTSDRAMEVTIETNMFGGFLQLVLPEEIGEITGLKIIPGREQSNKRPEYKKNTGLIIDARGIDFQPVIYPSIVSEQGDEVYSSRFISREYAVQAGVCQFSCNPDSIQTNKRTGSNPLIIRGLRKGGKTNQSIVISRSDAETIEKTAERHLFMKECRVVILLDQ